MDNERSFVQFLQSLFPQSRGDYASSMRAMRPATSRPMWPMDNTWGLPLPNGGLPLPDATMPFPRVQPDPRVPLPTQPTPDPRTSKPKAIMDPRPKPKAVTDPFLVKPKAITDPRPKPQAVTDPRKPKKA